MTGRCVMMLGLFLSFAVGAAQAADNGCRVSPGNPGTVQKPDLTFAIVSDFTSFQTARTENATCSLGAVLAWQDSRLNHTSAFIGNGLIIAGHTWNPERSTRQTLALYFQGNGTEQMAGGGKAAMASETMVLGGLGQVTFPSEIPVDFKEKPPPTLEKGMEDEWSPAFILRPRGGYEINTTGVRSFTGGVDVQTTDWSNSKLRFNAVRGHYYADPDACIDIWLCVSFVPEITVQYDRRLRRGGTTFQIFARGDESFRVIAQVSGQAHFPGALGERLSGLSLTFKLSGAVDPFDRQDEGFVQTGITYDVCAKALSHVGPCRPPDPSRSPTKLGVSVSYSYGNSPLSGNLASQIMVGLVVGFSAPDIRLSRWAAAQ